MPRPRRATGLRRIELRLAADDPLLEELAQEAERRGVELQQHIYDLLRGRFLLRRGESLATLLWLPGDGPAIDPATDSSVSLAEQPVEPSATAAAAAWGLLLGPAMTESRSAWYRPVCAAPCGRSPGQATRLATAVTGQE